MIALFLLIVWYFWADEFGTREKELRVQITTAPGILTNTIESGRVLLLFGSSKDDLDDTDVKTTNAKFFGMNVYNFSGQSLTLAGGSANNLEIGVFGWPIISLDEVPAGRYFVQGFMNIYNETITRSDGSTVSVRLPCGDGNPPLRGAGSLSTSILETQIYDRSQTIELRFQAVVPPVEFNGSEIGGCNQGNYHDTELVKYVKIRSETLSNFWNQDMYVGANVLLPRAYNATDKDTRYPVLYSQFHWLGGRTWWDKDAEFTEAWHKGTIPAQDEEAERPAPWLIIVMFRHENPFYDDSYAVNTPNLGPYGDALNDELVPYLDEMFNTIPEPYARIQEGGSTGGWAAAANLVFRPDLYGACFASYPDSLDFHRHQDNDLYTQSNTHFRGGMPVPSNRAIGEDLTPYVRATMEQVEHWELTFVTSGRSALQTDIWFAVFGVQGLNGYPLAAWDKVTGEIDPDVVQLWTSMDLTDYILRHWNGTLNLGEVLRGRMFVYVGGVDSYYLDEGVEQFRVRVTGRGGSNWANVTTLPGEVHGGIYNLLPKWTYLEMVLRWINEHAPDGETPLLREHTTTTSRGNLWQDVLTFGGHQAALDRQSPPHVDTYIPGSQDEDSQTRPSARASVRRWDPGVVLQARWLVNGRSHNATIFDVSQGQEITYLRGNRGTTLQLAVTGTKRDYVDKTRLSNIVTLS